MRDELAKGLIGGVVLYPDNIRSARQLRLLTAYLANANSELVPFIAVDQEGGRVQRLTPWTGHTHYPSAQKMGRDATLTPEAARRIYGEMAKELAGSGINVNFGPVVDLSVNPWNAVIARRKRSYGADPDTVTSLARSFIAAHREANVVTVAKHFPGHGSSWSDSHKTLPDISRSWRESELQPYVTLAHDGLLDMVMVGHLYHPRFSDGEKLPASLSANAVRALRADGYIGYHGVVVSDDMEMGAVRDRYGLEDRVIRALNAGVDLLVFSNVKSRDTELAPRSTPSSPKRCAMAASRARRSKPPMSGLPAKAPADGTRPCGEGVTPYLSGKGGIRHVEFSRLQRTRTSCRQRRDDPGAFGAHG